MAKSIELTIPRRMAALLVAASLVAALLVAVPAAAQIPDEFTNLQVLPEDIEKRALIDGMRSFAGSLGVRCIHCHVAENPDSLASFDFASDEKETKRVAREMMRMVSEINATHLPKTGREKVLAVGCATCHHGVKRPQGLRDLLAEVLKDGGIEAVSARYRELREEYYGEGVYNFGDATLARLAGRVDREGDPTTALALLDLNVEFHPESVRTFQLRGRIEAKTGARDDAIRSFERVLEIRPDDTWTQRQLEELKNAPAGESPSRSGS